MHFLELINFIVVTLAAEESSSFWELFCLLPFVLSRLVVFRMERKRGDARSFRCVPVFFFFLSLHFFICFVFNCIFHKNCSGSGHAYVSVAGAQQWKCWMHWRQQQQMKRAAKSPSNNETIYNLMCAVLLGANNKMRELHDKTSQTNIFRQHNKTLNTHTRKTFPFMCKFCKT